MRKITLLLLILVTHIQAQDLLLDVLPLYDSKVVYKNVLEVSESDKLALQQKVKTWFDENNIPIIEDKPLDDAHHLVAGEHSIRALWGPNDFKELNKVIEFRIALTLKKDRYQYEFSNFIVKEPNQAIQLEIYQMDKNKLQKYNPAFYERIDTQIKRLIISLEESLTQ